MIHISLDALNTILLNKNFELIDLKLPSQIASHLIAGKEKYPFFVKIDKENSIVQMIVFLPYALPKTHVSDVARLLHFYNKEIDIPGFGMDEKDGAIFYRYSIVGERGHISETIFDKILEALPKICETFFPMIALAMAGKVSFDTILEKSKQRKS